MFKDLREVFEAIRDKKISVEEGKRIIQELKKNNVNNGVVNEKSISNRIENKKLKAIVISRPELIDDLKVTSVDEREPLPHEVVILTKAASLNFADYLCVKGIYPNMPAYPFTPGFEISGIVIKAGSAVKKFQIGDEVIALMGENLGGHQEIAYTDEKLVVKKPENVSFEDACAFPIVFLTSYHVFKIANIKKGDKVLIQTAAGGVGLIAVQMALNIGAEVYATAGSDEKINYLRRLGVKYLINYREKDFQEEIMKMTDNYGVDVVLNTLSGDAIQKGINILAPEGRYVEIAMAGLRASNGLDLSHLVNNQTFYGIDLRRLLLNNTDLIDGYLNDMVDTLRSGTVKPTVCKVYDFSDIKVAYENIDKRANIGKIVVSNKNTAELEKKYLNNLKNDYLRDDIAIIGVSGKFPGAKNIEQFWENLSHGISSIKEIPLSRFDVFKYYDRDKGKKNKTYCKAGGMIDDIEKFDALFFNMSGKEAELTDPQQRLFMEECWNAIEDAGYSPEEMNGMKCAVFAGVGNSDYMMFSGNSDGNEPQSLWGTESSIVPARISYFMNLKGPSVAVNTACSSSLVALDLACENIWSGESKMAIVGGAFVVTTPAFYIAACNAGMLSHSGYCSAFDEKADGFMPGEGVAAIVLKPAKDAMRDHDNIYGIIKGCGINQDGKTNGITAPSGKSQVSLLTSVYNKFHIDPRDISYVEAHGTGTKLGDPIEFNSLTSSFRQFTDDEHYCAIGSVKTNIGHAVAAAGIAGIIKILLCMKHKKLVPTLNYHKHNEIIDIDNSPFYINTEEKEWKPANNKLLASVSSFGFSGTNAHVVVEGFERVEYNEREKTSYVFPFSAKTETALKKMLENFVLWYDSNKNDIKIQDVVYTLTVGRGFFEYRKAFVVDDFEDLKKQIIEFVTDGSLIKPVIINDSHDGISEDKKLLDILLKFNNEASVYKNCLYKAAELYENGHSFVLRNLYSNEGYWKISLPTYPFERERYWFDVKDSYTSIKSNCSNNAIAPLIDENNSDFEEIYFKKTLTADDFVLKNHIVKGKMVFPAAASIEMAAEAIREVNNSEVIQFNNIIWAKPIIVDEFEKKDIYISLFKEKQKYLYEIWENEDEREIFCQGEIVDFVDHSEIQRLDVKEIKKELAFISGSDKCYKLFNQSAIDYSNEFIILDEIYGKNNKVLAKLKKCNINAFYENTKIIPYVLDGAIQSLVGFALMEQSDKRDTFLPFKMKKMVYYNDIRNAEYAYSIQNNDRNSFTIFVTDHDGNVLLEINGLLVIKNYSVDSNTIYMYEERCITENITVEHDLKNNKTLLVFSDALSLYEENTSNKVVEVTFGNEFKSIGKYRYIINHDSESDYIKLFENLLKNDIICDCILNCLDLSKISPEEYYQEYTRNIYLFRALVRSGYPRVDMYVVLINSGYEKIGMKHSFIGMVNSAVSEGIRINPYVISIEDRIADISDIIKKEINFNKRTGAFITYKNGQRSYSELCRIRKDITDCESKWKDKGVYILLGGTGKIGRIIAKNIISESSNEVFLVGRSIDKYQSIEELFDKESERNRLHLEKADVLDIDSLEAIREKAKKFGQIKGILFLVGVLNDSLIVDKNLVNAEKTVKCKINGILNVDKVFGQEPIDHFIIFSSLSSVLGNVGQSDYSYSNGFLTDFERYRNSLFENGKCNGKTYCIGWPLWKNGGMQLPDDVRNRLGMQPLSTEKGINIINYAIQNDLKEIYVNYGAKDILSLINVDNNDRSIEYDESKKEFIYDYLKTILANEINIPKEKIDINATLDKYGIDSLMIKDFNESLEKDFGELSSTLLFEYQTLNELGLYFLDNYGAKIEMLMDGQNSDNTKEVIASVEIEEDNRGLEKLVSYKKRALSEDSEIKRDAELAIVGISGSYPMAKDLDEFWMNLCQSRECISEMPSDRWDLDKWQDIIERSDVPCTKGGFIEDIAGFDTGLFSISPREAFLMDPQERMMLENVWNTIEDAGYTRNELKEKKVGVFIGAMYEHYQLYGSEGRIEDRGVPASSFASIANRISYFFNFRGPSIAFDTMCSSSLTALHAARISLEKGECDIAIVGGINLITHPYKYMLLAQGHFISKDGKCRSFGADGEGYVQGEGVGSLMLTKLENAKNDRDHIYGILKGSAINHGGKTNGFSVPNPNEQANVIKQAYVDAGIISEKVSYIEAHGTGTTLGDPIEITGLEKGIGKEWISDKKCHIGSVKSNIGHLESAAGIASVTKVLLQMKYDKLVPSINSDVLNPNINFDKSHFVIQHSVQDWAEVADGNERIAGISAFGAGGSNAHVIIENYNDSCDELKTDDNKKHIFVFSARSVNSILSYLNKFRNYITLHCKTLSSFEKTKNSYYKCTDILNDISGILQISADDISYSDTFAEIGAEANDLVRISIMLSEKYSLNNITINSNTSIQDLINEFPEEYSDLYGMKKDKFKLKDIEYTLCYGREAMKCRLAIIAEDLSELLNKIDIFIEKSTENVDFGIFFGSKKNEDEEAETYDQNDIYKIAELWCKHSKVDFSAFIDDDARKISLPGYLFENKRYWITDEVQKLDNAKRVANESSMTRDELVEIIEDQLKTIISDVLCIDKESIETDTNYSEFGFESITLKEFADRFQELYDIEFAPTVFYSKTNISQLSEYIVDEFEGTIRQRISENKSESESTSEKNASYNEPIAIIGIFGRFPQSDDPDEYFRNLLDEKDLITEIPIERWDWKEFHPDYSDGNFTTRITRGGFINDADKFDPKFFKISPVEAIMMDPQQRIFLEAVWKGIEDSGYRTSDFSGKNIGVFAGVQFHDYQHLLANGEDSNPMMSLGNEHSILVNRVSYLLNFHGPSEAYNTACSSSGVAIHRAIQSLKGGECEMAVAGGVSLNISPYSFISADQMGILSPDASCKTLDAAANGYAKGEGVGVVVLKPLSKAERDHDHIYAVIRGTSVNHGGKAASLTAPNSDAQAQLLKDVYENTGISVDTITYLELHGTGTELGDPVEIEGIKKAFNDLAKKHDIELKKNYCGIGCVKTNIGHLETSSGMAGVIKMVKALEAKKLPGLIHFENLNPYIKLIDSPFYIVNHTQEWKHLYDNDNKCIPLRAGISTFGFGGVNAHILLEEYVNEENSHNSSSNKLLFALSAKNDERLLEYSKKYYTFISAYDNIDINKLSYTLLCGREAMEARLCFVFSDKEELLKKLSEFIDDKKSEDVFFCVNKSVKSSKKLIDPNASNEGIDEIAKMWTNGENFDFTKFFDKNFGRISLPTYPFARERYWTEATWKNTNNTAGSADLAEKYNDIELKGSGYEFIEKSLTTIVSETLKMKPEDLDPDVAFYEYGVDSILLSILISVMHDCFGIQLSVNNLLENNTVHSLAKYIDEHTEGSFDMTHLLRNENASGGVKLSNLLPFNTEGSHQASFWVHGAPGYATFFRDLAEAMGNDYPLYAFQAKGVDGKEMPQLIYEMAQDYVKSIKAVQPEGPYVIGGYSYGGLVAYEMAQILAEAGDKITSLIMYDTMPATEEMNVLYNDLVDTEDNSFIKLLMANEFAEVKNTGVTPISLNDIKDITPKMQTYYLSKFVKEKSVKSISQEEIYNYLDGTLRVVSFSEESYAVYTAKPYDASPVLYMKAEKGFLSNNNFLEWPSVNFGDKYDYVQPWKELIKDFHLGPIPSDHFSGLEYPALDVLVKMTKRMIPKKGEELVIDEPVLSVDAIDDIDLNKGANKNKKLRPEIIPMDWADRS